MLLGNNIPFTPELPNSTQYRTLYYEGKNALLPNLPHPKIHVREDHPVYHIIIISVTILLLCESSESVIK
jgi:hypothetical protein